MKRLRAALVAAMALQALLWTLPALAGRPLPELTPDWSVRVDGSRVDLLVNRFTQADREGDFPRRSFRILHGEKPARPDSARRSTPYSFEMRYTAARLEVDRDGIPASDSLHFVPSYRISADGAASFSDIPGLEDVARDLPGFSEWMLSPDGGWAVLYGRLGYVILETPSLQELGRGTNRMMWPVVSTDSNRLAMVELVRDPDPAQWPETEGISRLCVWDRNGPTNYRTPWEPDFIRPILFSGEQTRVLYVWEDGDEIMCWDFDDEWNQATGVMEYVGGTKLSLSSDGKTLITTARDLVSAYLFEDELPCEARPKGAYILESGRVSNRAVSADGEFVAIEIYFRGSETGSHSTHVVVLDRELHPLAKIPTRTAEVLEFAGECLFVWDGSSYLTAQPVSSSQSIKGYDLSRLK